MHSIVILSAVAADAASTAIVYVQTRWTCHAAFQDQILQTVEGMKAAKVFCTGLLLLLLLAANQSFKSLRWSKTTVTYCQSNM